MASVKRRGPNHIGFRIDLSGLIDFLAAGEALGEAGMDKEYMDNVMSTAFENANDEFNLEAAAYGATGEIAHMFEWGTVGINQGRTNRRASPNSESSRLWEFHQEGYGLKRTLTFIFKPSTAFVPKPTVRDTGMDAETIAGLKDHVFEWKAEVMEEGTPVHIEPVEAKFLLIPAYPNRRQYFRPRDVKRGYMLSRGPVTTVPGIHVHGNFSRFWIQFWEGRGAQIVDEQLEMFLRSDFVADIAKSNVHLSKATRPVQTVNVLAEVAAKKKQVKKKAQIKARGREASKRDN